MVILLGCMSILPYVFTELILLQKAEDGEERDDRKAVLWGSRINVVFNLLLFLTVFIVVTKSKTPMATFMKIVSYKGSYKEVGLLVWVNIICTIFSIALGLILRKNFYHEGLKFSPLVQGRLLLVFIIWMIPCIYGLKLSHTAEDGLHITQICRKVIENDQEYSYIVLTNEGNLTFDEDLLYLSDEEEDLKKFPIKNIVIGPGETKKIVMTYDAGPSLKKKGGTDLYLTNTLGVVVDSAEVPAMETDTCCTLTEGNWSTETAELTEEEIPEETLSLVTALEVTEEDSDAPETVVEAPTFSQPTGIYESGFYLTITAPEGTKIYYTTDSSTPTIKSKRYKGKIWIDDTSSEPDKYASLKKVKRYYDPDAEEESTSVPKCEVIRAIAVDEDGNVSDVTTSSYFVGIPQLRETTVMSLVSDPDGLFNEDTGIYMAGTAYEEWYEEWYKEYAEDYRKGKAVFPATWPQENYMLTGRDSEREAYMEILRNGTTLISQKVGIRIQGNAARYALSKKRFSIYSRKEYSGSKYFNVNLINDFRQHSWFTRPGNIFAFCQTLGQGRKDMLTQDYTKLYMFLDGEYWYNTYLFEKYDESNLAEKLDLTEDNIVMIKSVLSAAEIPDEAEKGTNPYTNIFSFFDDHDMSITSNYDKYDEIIDIQSYIDMICYQTYLANMDYNEGWNTLIWHTIIPENDEEGDGRWRWAMYDMDLVWSLADDYGGSDIEPYEINPFTQRSQSITTPLEDTTMFSNLMKNSKFRQQYMLTFMDLMNTRFSRKQVLALYKEMDIDQPDLKAFLKNRESYILKYTMEEFEVEGTAEDVTISTNARNSDAVTLNTIQPDLTTGTWTGQYYTDYPVTVTVNEKWNQTFSHWEVTSGGVTTEYTDETITVPVVEGGVEINAVFE